jgi:hypothetical protein
LCLPIFGSHIRKLPAGIDDWPKELKNAGSIEVDEFADKISANLAKESDDFFTPSLAAIRRWITTLKFAE